MTPEDIGRLFDPFPEGIVLVDAEGRIWAGNRAAFAAFAAGPSEVLGRPLRERLADPGPGLDEYLRFCARSTEPLPGAFTLRPPEGPPVRQWCKGCAYRAEAPPGSVLLRFGPRVEEGDPFVLLSQKIQELNEEILLRRRSEQEVRRLNQELEDRVRRRTAELQEAVAGLNDFAYSISHDLKAPLRSIHRYTQLLVEDYAGKPLDDEGLSYAQSVLRSAVAMNQLIEDLLAYSRLSRIEITLAPIGPGPILQAVLDGLALEIRESRADVQVAPDLPPVVGDPVLLSQALTNLVSNALKFRKPKDVPKVRIGAERSPERVRLWVEDQGIGIASEHAGRLYRMFERLEPRAYPGTGVGLALVRKAAERMQGRTGFVSTPGEGSRFWIELPAGGSAT